MTTDRKPVLPSHVDPVVAQKRPGVLDRSRIHQVHPAVSTAGHAAPQVGNVEGAASQVDQNINQTPAETSPAAEPALPQAEDYREQPYELDLDVDVPFVPTTGRMGDTVTLPRLNDVVEPPMSVPAEANALDNLMSDPSVLRTAPVDKNAGTLYPKGQPKALFGDHQYQPIARPGIQALLAQAAARDAEGAQDAADNAAAQDVAAELMTDGNTQTEAAVEGSHAEASTPPAGVVDKATATEAAPVSEPATAEATTAATTGAGTPAAADASAATPAPSGRSRATRRPSLGDVPGVAALTNHERAPLEFEHMHGPVPADKNAVTAPLGNNESDPEAGSKRRRNVAYVLGVAGGLAGGVSTVVAAKMTATAVAVWLGAPALGVAALGVGGVMAGSMLWNYIQTRRRYENKGIEKPKFWGYAAPALMAGGLATAALFTPVIAMAALATAVAGLGAGWHDYNTKRKEKNEDFNGFEFFKSLFTSKSTRRAVLIGGLISGVFAMFAMDNSTPQLVSTPDAPTPPAPAPVVDAAPAAPTPAPEAPAPAVDVTPPPPTEAAQPTPEQTTTPAQPAAEVKPTAPAPAQPAAESRSFAPAPSVVQQPAPIDYTQMPPTSVTTDAHGVRTTVYASGIIETATPIVSDAAPVDANTTDAPAAETAPAPVGGEAPAADAPTAPAVQEPANVPAQEGAATRGLPSAAFTQAVETTSAAAPAASPAPVATPVPAVPQPVAVVPATPTAQFTPAAAAPVAAQPLPATAHCVMSSVSNIQCNAVATVVQPGSGAEFRLAADPQAAPYFAEHSPKAPPMNVADFLRKIAVPEAQAAYKLGQGLQFIPKP